MSRGGTPSNLEGNARSKSPQKAAIPEDISYDYKTQCADFKRLMENLIDHFKQDSEGGNFSFYQDHLDDHEALQNYRAWVYKKIQQTKPEDLKNLQAEFDLTKAIFWVTRLVYTTMLMQSDAADKKEWYTQLAYLTEKAYGVIARRLDNPTATDSGVETYRSAFKLNFEHKHKDASPALKECGRIIAQRAGLTKESHCLEIGSGMGFLRDMLPEEISLDMLEFNPLYSAINLASHPGSKVFVKDGWATEAPSDSYDTVFELGVYDIIDRLPDVITETARVLKPGGKFVHLIELKVVNSSIAKRINSWSMDLFNRPFVLCQAENDDSEISYDGPSLEELEGRLAQAEITAYDRERLEFLKNIAELMTTGKRFNNNEIFEKFMEIEFKNKGFEVTFHDIINGHKKVSRDAFSIFSPGLSKKYDSAVGLSWTENGESEHAWYLASPAAISDTITLEASMHMMVAEKLPVTANAESVPISSGAVAPAAGQPAKGTQTFDSSGLAVKPQPSQEVLDLLREKGYIAEERAVKEAQEIRLSGKARVDSNGACLTVTMEDGRYIKINALKGFIINEGVARATIGERIKVLRLAAGLTRQALAEKIGVWDTTIYVWEKNNKSITYANIKNLAKALEVNEEVITGKPPLTIDSIAQLPTVGERIRALRVLKGFTRKELAVEVGVTPNTIYVWESNDFLSISLSNLIKLSEELGVDKEFLMVEQKPIDVNDLEKVRKLHTAGDRVRVLRVLKGLTQIELAGMVGVKNYTLSDWERGVQNIRSSNITRLATAFGVDEEIIKGESKEMPSWYLDKIRQLPAVGDRIRNIMQLRGFTGIRLAQEIGVRKKAVYDWLNNKSSPNPENLMRLAAALDVSKDIFEKGQRRITAEDIIKAEELSTAGERICFLRRLRGLSQKKLADRIQVNNNTICRWERNKVSIGQRYLMKLAYELGVDVNIIKGMPSVLASQPAKEVVLVVTDDRQYSDSLNSNSNKQKIEDVNIVPVLLSQDRPYQEQIQEAIDQNHPSRVYVYLVRQADLQGLSMEVTPVKDIDRQSNDPIDILLISA